MASMKRLKKRAEKTREIVRDFVREILQQKDAQGRMVSAAQKREDALGREIAAAPELKNTDAYRYDEKLRAYRQAADQVKQGQRVVSVLCGIENSLQDLVLQMDSMVTLGLYRKLLRTVRLRKIRRLIRTERLDFLIQVDELLAKTRENVHRTILEAMEERNNAIKVKKHQEGLTDAAEAMMGNSDTDERAATEEEIRKKYANGANN